MTRLTYDPKANAAAIYLEAQIAPDELAQTRLCNVRLEQAAVILGFDAEGLLIKIEILGAARLLPPEALDEAERPPSDWESSSRVP